MTELEKRGEDPNEESVEVPEGGGSVSFERVKLYLERHPELFNLAGEIDFHDDYVGEDWPHRGYALARKDIQDLLDDCQEYQREVMEANEAANNLMEQKRQWAKDHDEVARLRNLVHSMRFNGARHHFVFAYDRYVGEAGKRLQFCRDCEKDKGHPSHFAQGARYLDSREVEKQAQEALKRLANMLESQGFKPLTAQNTARELLKSLPGILLPIEPEEGV